MRETAITAASIVDAYQMAEKHGWDSRYGKYYRQQQLRKVRLRHMLYRCYCELGDVSAGELMDSDLFKNTINEKSTTIW